MGSSQSTALPIRKKPTVLRASYDDVSVQEFGKDVLKLFLIDPSYRNLNNGSFGSIPRAIQARQRQYQDMAEARPDPFIRYEYPKLLDESRAAVAKLLRVSTETVVFLNNTTTGTNTVLHNLIWAEDCKDEILYFSTVYGALGKTIDYIVESRYQKVSSRAICLDYPIEDVDIVAKFYGAVSASKSEGKRPRICIFDVVSSLPGVRFPFEAMTAACKESGVMSCIDGAHGVGMVDLNLGELDPDFFVSNCHKWLHVPRGCAVFMVPVRNQDLIRSSVPTSHGYVPENGQRLNPLPPTKKPRFVNAFEFVGTLDNAPFLCVKDSIKWRKEVLGGEAKIMEYQRILAKTGGKRVAEILETWILENKKGTLTDCAMVNVALPLIMANEDKSDANERKAGDAEVPHEYAPMATQWILTTLIADYQTFIALHVIGRRWYARLSAQVFLSAEDFEWAGEVLKQICQRVGNGEYATTGETAL